MDTSVLIWSLAGERVGLAGIRGVVEEGVVLAMSALVLHEWLRGDRSAEEKVMLEILLPAKRVIPFTAEQAGVSAAFYRALPRARSRVMDLCIAACAVSHEMPLWTLHEEDFEDVPGLELFKLS